MKKNEELFLKFPTILAQKLISGEISFPDNTKFDYDSVLVYRVVEREEGDNHEVDNDDFKSYFELNKTPKVPRGMKVDFRKDPHYYGVSSFKDIKRVEQKKLFPKPGKKIAKGYVYKDGGPQDTGSDGHVCWWLYCGITVEGFKIIG